MSVPATPGSRRATRLRAARYALVGLLSLVVDFGVYASLYRFTPVGVEVAAASGYCAAFAVNFGLNRFWVFSAGAGSGTAQARRFVALSALNFALTVLIVSALVRHGLEYRLAKLLVAGMLAGSNFVIMGRWVFASPGEALGQPL